MQTVFTMILSCSDAVYYEYGQIAENDAYETTYPRMYNVMAIR